MLFCTFRYSPETPYLKPVLNSSKVTEMTGLLKVSEITESVSFV